MKKIIIFILVSHFYFSQDKGKIAYDSENYEQSYDYYLNILDKREDDASAKFGAGVSAYKIQDLESALNFLKKASNTDDNILSSKAYYNLANIYKDENRIEESLSYYKKAIELNPKDQDARINFELLKKLFSKQQENQDSPQDQNNEGNDQQQENQDSPQDQNNEKSSNANENSEQEKETPESRDIDDQGNGLKDKEPTDKEIQAEAILNALKDQEKINQKQKLLKVKAKNLEKDW